MVFDLEFVRKPLCRKSRTVWISKSKHYMLHKLPSIIWIKFLHHNAISPPFSKAIIPPGRQCQLDELLCAKSQVCIPRVKSCDKRFDCEDGSDERSCRESDIPFFFVFRCYRAFLKLVWGKSRFTKYGMLLCCIS